MSRPDESSGFPRSGLPAAIRSLPVTRIARRPLRHLLVVAPVGVAVMVVVGGLLALASAPGGAAVASRASPAPKRGAVPRSRPVALPLRGKVVGIDPGHNGRNYTDPGYLTRQVWNGRELENCDTTGTQTNASSPYTEALFNFQVASYLRADLIKDGATVVMTRTSNNGIGPCIDTRSFIINRARANVAVDIHADGAPVWGRGFAILEPVADGPNDKVIASSARLGADIRAALLAGTAMPMSNYDGKQGINHRDDLAGLNLTQVPKVLIEVGNMKNPVDARLLTSPGFQQQVARAFLAAIIEFLK